jgi:hypothetical protein
LTPYEYARKIEVRVWQLCKLLEELDKVINGSEEEPMNEENINHVAECKEPLPEERLKEAPELYEPSMRLLDKYLQEVLGVK